MDESKTNIVIREAKVADMRLFFEWANDPVVRQMAFHSEPIPWDNHVVWFRRKLDSNAALLLLGYHGGRPVGQVRFDITNDGSAEIDISVDKEFRGKGLGKLMLVSAIEYASKKMNVSEFISEVKEENLSSQRLFMSAGFVHINTIDGVCFFKKIRNRY